MINYIIADYKRVLTRVPRIILIVLYELVFIGVVLFKWYKSDFSFTSVALLDHANTFIYAMGPLIIGLIDFLSSFSFDFKAKTMQVAIGIGISRLRVIISKLIQVALLILTDIVFSAVILGILCIITGVQLAPHQFGTLIVDMIYVVIYSSIISSLVMFVVFKLQNLLLPMVLYFLLDVRLIRGGIRLITRMGPEFLSRMNLERFTFEHCTEQLRTRVLMGGFDFGCFIGIFIFLALGVFLTWLVFRKMELDF